MSKAGESPSGGAGSVIDIELGEATRNRFLNYAVSVITSRALPDVRDGLKPVQRRILYTMAHDLHLTPEKSTMKCAKVVGQVLGQYHPHGDSAVYEALVRMAQPWTLRYPLIFGQGNFGSLDGDSAAAYRYTEARLTPIAVEFVKELPQETVDYRRNFDDSLDEPVVLPARFPQLLANGCTGIAVGVATNVPPHNLTELCLACEALVDKRDLPTAKLVEFVQGPDFPTGGEILEDRISLIKLYEEGQGRVRIRGQYRLEEEPRKGPMIVISSIPYMVNKSELLEEMGELVMARKVPQVLDVRDESTDEVRIVLDLRRDADPHAVMAYMFKNTNLQNYFHVNMTCLVTPPGASVGGPARLGLRDMLLHFLDFRHEVTIKRLQYDLRALLARMHILDGFTRVFDALDEALVIIRNANGKADASKKLQARFELDEPQAEAVLVLQLYKIGRPDILEIRKELEEKRKATQLLEELLANPARIWALVKREIKDIRTLYGDARRTVILEGGATSVDYTEDQFIVDEDAVVVLTKDGWIRRISTGTDLSKLRFRQDDEFLAILRGSTRTTAAFFSSSGTCYTARLNDIPLTPRGLGDPIQKYFNLSDGERIIAGLSLDPKITPGLMAAPVAEGAQAADPACLGLVMTTDGRGYRFSLEPFLDASTKSGRRYARPSEGAEVAQILFPRVETRLIVVSREGRALVCELTEVGVMSGAAKGLTLVKLEDSDRLLGGALSRGSGEGLIVVRVDGGKEIPVNPGSVRPTARGGKGTQLIKRGQLKIVPPPSPFPSRETSEEDERPAQ